MRIIPFHFVGERGRVRGERVRDKSREGVIGREKKRERLRQI